MRLGAFVAIVTCLLAPGAMAATPAGKAVGVNPSAQNIVANTTRTLKVGSEVAMGDKIVTGPSGQVQLVFNDDTHLVVGPSSFETGEFRAQMDPRVFDTAEVYDPATGTFTLAGSLPPIDRAALAAEGVPVPTEDPWMTSVGALVALPDGGALLVGHRDSWKHQADVVRDFRFDAAAGRWTQVGPAWAGAGDWSGNDVVWRYTPGIDRSGASVGPLPDGRVLEAGGFEIDAQSGDQHASATARAWDPATGQWSPLPPMPGARSGGAAATLGDGSVMIVGGDWSESGGETAIRFVPGG